MKKKCSSVPARLAAAALAVIVLLIVLEALGAYLVFNGTAGEGMTCPLVLLAGGIAAFLAILLFKLPTFSLCAISICSAWLVLEMVGLVFFGSLDLKFSAAMLLAFLVGTILARYLLQWIAKRGKKGKMRRKKK